MRISDWSSDVCSSDLYGVFNVADQHTAADIEAGDVDQQIGHGLAGGVQGDLAAAIAMHHGNVAGGEHMFGLASLAESEHWRVFERPDFVGRGEVGRTWCRGRVWRDV